MRLMIPIAAVVCIGLSSLGCARKSDGPTVDGKESSQPAKSRVKKTRSQSPAKTDVVVVGAGISGLSTALELGRGGAKVLVIDMSSVFGGHAVMSQGGVCIVDTPLQRKLGIKDSPDLAYKDFIKWGEDANPAWVRYYVDHSRREIYDWLMNLGVEFESVLTAPGNSVNRFHQPTGRGIGLVTPIYRACLENGNVRFDWNTRAVKLVIERKRVVGVVTRHERTKTERTIRARAVVLATGGFQSNLDMVREYWPREFRFPERILAGSGRNSTGSGIAIAQQAGGGLSKMDHQWNYFTGIPDPRFPNGKRGLSAANMHGIIVNAEGQRFANLHNWAKEVMPALLRQKRATLWFLFDESSKPFFTVSGSGWGDFKTVERLILKNPRLVKTANSIGELADKAGLPRDTLIATIRRYNALVDTGTDADFHRFGPTRPERANSESPKIATPPFYAMQTWPLTRKSMGGVAIDRSCRVLDKHGQQIPGLYAVGELTGEAGINGKAALEGTFLGPCILTGRVAGRSLLTTLAIPAVIKPVAKSAACVSCHKLTEDIAKNRPGYWHFAKVHTAALERRTDCRDCHAELSPYRRDAHRIHPLALSATCQSCHRGK